ncbi:response regulator transcription factor [Paraburkholderia kirstenboschensis]|uniref:Response regulator n=1 Tax=Paraburkholderia kirstenboschensis TaxID=1245436 RepID=A0ABZ0E8M9_9BURK|nr:response regulator [Paraburkholderia kirstenboschensis]WOD13588.1 response regulator [Paraburkholderia kirstenboschensis]
MPTPPVRTVAVIDDDRRVLTSLANLLASGGYGTRVYESALDFLSDGYSGLVCIVTDLGMRPIDGMQVLERVAHSSAAAPVIIITGNPGVHTEDYYLQRGALGFFSKPVDGEALLDLLDSIA